MVSTTALPPEVSLYTMRASCSMSPCLPLPTHSPASPAKRSKAAFCPCPSLSDRACWAIKPQAANARASATAILLVILVLLSVVNVADEVIAAHRHSIHHGTVRQ